MITYTWEVFDLVTLMSGVIFMQLYKSKQVLFIERWCRWLSFSHTASKHVPIFFAENIRFEPII